MSMEASGVIIFGITVAMVSSLGEESYELLRIKFARNAEKVLTASYSKGVYEGENGLRQVYADDNVFCGNFSKRSLVIYY